MGVPTMTTGPSLAERVPIGRSALRTKRLWLGTVNFSGRVPDEDALRLLDHARERGIDCIDTADIYGWRVHKGHTEELLGRWFARGGGRREDIVLATKVGGQMTDRPGDGGLSSRHVIAACEGSLRRLGVDHIDIFQPHQVDRTTTWDEVWEAMDVLVTSGKVRYVGSSNFAGWHIAAAQENAARGHRLGIIAHQCLYNLTVRHAELEVMPAAEAYGVGVFAWSPLHGGLLGGVLRKLREGTAVKSAQGRAQAALPALRSAVESYEKFCQSVGADPAEVGLAWVLSRPGVTGAVIGPRTPDQLDSAVRATHRKLADDEMDELESIFPVSWSGGPAPEAWLG
ncbi:aldo/keto reductase [Amycolatopsis sp. WAC 01376]|uniref:aldo/keto reductase n=1 Tax=Amycolatopsis sp. WAC 01376 TaxID=2203195 RepID=UPI003513A146